MCLVLASWTLNLDGICDRFQCWSRVPRATRSREVMMVKVMMMLMMLMLMLIPY